MICCVNDVTSDKIKSKEIFDNNEWFNCRSIGQQHYYVQVVGTLDLTVNCWLKLVDEGVNNNSCSCSATGQKLSCDLKGCSGTLNLRCFNIGGYCCWCWSLGGG